MMDTRENKLSAKLLTEFGGMYFGFKSIVNLIIQMLDMTLDVISAL